MSDFKGFGVEPIKKSKSKKPDTISAVKRTRKLSEWERKVMKASYRTCGSN